MTNRAPASVTPSRKRIRLDAAEYRAEGRVFLVTICTVDRRPWFSLHPPLADIATATIVAIADARWSTLHAWCVMPDHVHLLMEDTDVVGYVRVFKGSLTTRARCIDPHHRLWQRSFHDHAPRSGVVLVETARYVLDNPVRAGIVAAAAQYRWSGSGTWPDWRNWG